MFTVVITGPPGAGKTSVLTALVDALTDEDVAHAAIELEMLAWTHPALPDEVWLRHVEATCALYRAAGHRLLLVAETLETDDDLARLLDAVGADERLLVRLEADPATLVGRITEREPESWSGLAELVEHTQVLATTMPTLRGVDLVVSTEGRRPEEAAARIRAALPGHVAASGSAKGLGVSPPAPTIPADDPLAVEVVEAIRGGDVERLRSLLDDNPELARAQIADVRCDDTRSLLHVATDWPGHFPNGPEVVRTLVAAGGQIDARGGGKISETPLHWAASSDDIAVLDALIDAGAAVDVTGAVIAGGTPLEDAVAFGQWNAARRLVGRGATVRLREAAALGLTDVVREHLPAADADEISMAFWYACHGGQRATAELLLDRGAELDWIAPWDGLTPLDAAVRSGARDVGDWLRARGAHTAAELG